TVRQLDAKLASFIFLDIFKGFGAPEGSDPALLNKSEGKNRGHRIPQQGVCAQWHDSPDKASQRTYLSRSFTRNDIHR
ncbi:MAG: hypothetical protein AB9880_12555, partial [Christensenellales bacterium]